MIFYVERWKRVWMDGAYTDVWNSLGLCDVLFEMLPTDRKMIVTVCQIDHTIGFNVSVFDTKIDANYMYFNGTLRVGKQSHELFKIRCKI